ncbi:MAG: hypothetical protein ACM3O4_04985 [Ignavibacteriales bacterium]
MKLFDKIKNLFIEEVEDEKPIKKEVIKVEIPSPEEQKLKEIEKVGEEILPDSLGVLKKEEKYNTVVFFDDKDFDTLTGSQDFKNKPVPKREVYINKEAKEEKKLFKATPIISPIYGILDKNYHREDITPKKKNRSSIYEVDDITVEDVRNKAYGTLEEELETTLFSKPSIIVNKEEVVEKEKVTDMFEELEQEANYTNNEIDSIDDTIEMDLLNELQAQSHEISLAEEAMDKEGENIEESDLFNLIDSMYDKREEE